MNASLRKIGICISNRMTEKSISPESLADNTGYSYRDICRLIEGELMLSPVELEKIANQLDLSLESLVRFEPDDNMFVPSLVCNKPFENKDNLYKIIDLLDMYIELKEG